MMRVAVVNPPWPGEGYGARTNVRWPHRRGDKKLAFPIYLAYTNALLKDSGYESKGIDAVWEEWDTERFVGEMKGFSPKAVLMEVSTPSITFDLETARRLKSELPDAMIVFCGPHATHFHKELVRDHKFIDACIRGEFELTFKAICDAARSKKSMKSVEGITYRDKGKVIVNGDRPLLENLDSLPWPDRKDFPIERYQQAFYCGEKTALLLSSRGCPFQCTYCLWPSTLTSRRYRIRDPKKVVDEIEHLIKTDGIDEVFFDDDEFTVNRKKVQEFCEEMIKRKIRIKWHCMGRVDVVDEKTLRMMKEAGCYQIFYGFESGSQKILDAVKKGITKAQTKAAVRMTKKAGMVCGGSFVMGSPQESRETVKETIGFAKGLGADWVQFTLAAPFPGTPMYRECKDKGLLETESWEDFDGSKGPIVRTEHLSRQELEGIQRKAYIAYYTAPRVIWANIISIRSFSQVKRILRGMKSVMSRLVYYKK